LKERARLAVARRSRRRFDVKLGYDLSRSFLSRK